MSSQRNRQISRLETRMQPRIERAHKLRRKAQFEMLLATAHAACLAFISRYGRPEIGEPLWRACKRVEASEAWEECCQNFPVSLGEIAYAFRPYSDFLWLAMPIRHCLIHLFPGDNEKDKLNRVFESAPPWLLWFTCADHTARRLGLRLPDLSAVTGYQRLGFRNDERVFSEAKFRMPYGAFVPTPWPDGIITEPPARVRIIEGGWPLLFPRGITELNRKEQFELLHASWGTPANWLATARAILRRKNPESDA